MYKIEIDWDFRSPTLAVLTGNVRIGQIGFGLLDKQKFPSFPVKKDRYTLGYKNCSALFGRCKPIVDIMTRSYYDGMLMRNESVQWFRDCYRKNENVYITIPD